MNTWDVFFEFAARARFGIAECANFTSDLTPMLRIEHRVRPSASTPSASDPEISAEISPDIGPNINKVAARDRSPRENDGLGSLLAQYLLYRF